MIMCAFDEVDTHPDSAASRYDLSEDIYIGHARLDEEIGLQRERERSASQWEVSSLVRRRYRASWL